jgi:hypothetical protein
MQKVILTQLSERNFIKFKQLQMLLVYPFCINETVGDQNVCSCVASFFFSHLQASFSKRLSKAWHRSQIQFQNDYNDRLHSGLVPVLLGAKWTTVHLLAT